MIQDFGKVLNVINVSSVKAVAHMKASNYKQRSIFFHQSAPPENKTA